MNTAPTAARRPFSCLKSALRYGPPQRQTCHRPLATMAENPAASPTSTMAPDIRNFFKIRNHKTKKIRTAFAVYNPPAPSPSSTLPTKIPPNPLPALHAAQIARQDPTGARTALFSKTNPDSARVGDVVLVTHRRRGEPFAGVLMSIRRAGIDTAIQLRNTLMRVGVEQWFKVYNKNVAGIEIVKRRTRRARRARLTYLRKPKHDVGSLEGAVFAWKKSRNVLTTKDRTRPGANAALAAKGTKKAKK